MERLSGVAAFSKFHFRRQFAALFGLSAFPLFAQRLNLYPEVPESEANVDIFLPLT